MSADLIGDATHVAPLPRWPWRYFPPDEDQADPPQEPERAYCQACRREIVTEGGMLCAECARAEERTVIVVEEE